MAKKLSLKHVLFNGIFDIQLRTYLLTFKRMNQARGYFSTESKLVMTLTNNNNNVLMTVCLV